MMEGGSLANIEEYMKENTCFDILPVNSRVKKRTKCPYLMPHMAIFGHYCVVYSPELEKIVHALSSKDLLDILLYYRKKDGVVSFSMLKHTTLWEWLVSSKKNAAETIPVLTETCTLRIALDVMIESKQGWVAVMKDSDNGDEVPLGIISLKDILVKIWRHGLKGILNKPIEELDFGTFDDITKAKCDDTIASAFVTLKEKNLISMPVVDSNGSIINEISISHTPYLAVVGEGGNVAFDMEIGAFLKLLQKRIINRYISARSSDNLWDILNSISSSIISRMFVVDTIRTKQVVGVLSAGDVVRYLYNLLKKK